MNKILISFDTTGSMNPAIVEVRRKVKETIEKLFEAYGNNLQMCILAHGDYADRESTYDVVHTGFSSNKDYLMDFVKTVKKTNGYSSSECYEYVLNIVSKLDWADADSRALVMIGDATPHIKGRHTDRGIYCELDWAEELNSVKEKGINVYAVQCLGRGGHFWQTLGKTNQGAYVTLDQFGHINELLLAIGHKEANTLGEYIQQLEQSKLLLNRGIGQFIDQLQGKTTVREARTKEGLVPVEPGRFQVLNVDKDTSIKDFVESTGAAFKTGRGFYYFNKRELVQERKEVVLVDKETGDMLTGAEARDIIGIPWGTRGKISPSYKFAHYDVFIQSTSYNRKLKAGTKFLYEVK